MKLATLSGILIIAISIYFGFRTLGGSHELAQTVALGWIGLAICGLIFLAGAYLLIAAGGHIKSAFEAVCEPVKGLSHAQSEHVKKGWPL
jgi:hypothetical protein